MTPNQAIKKFGGVTQLAKALGISRQTVYNWIDRGGVPAHWQAFVNSIGVKVK